MNHIEGKERIKSHICTIKLMTQVNKNHKVNKNKQIRTIIYHGEKLDNDNRFST